MSVYINTSIRFVSQIRIEEILPQLAHILLDKTSSMQATELIGILHKSNRTGPIYVIVPPASGTYALIAFVLIVISVTLTLVMLCNRSMWKYTKTMTTLITITSLLWCSAICIAFAYPLPETKFIVFTICIVLNALAVTLGRTIHRLKRKVLLSLFTVSLIIDLIGTVMIYLSLGIYPIRNFQALAEICWCAGACIVTFITINAL
uniref:Uncharacterized protein n=1 Tax=Trichobilharzia regenti TaxID=157069 RepID=A0AA85J4N9_TRIRE|nr:unnamed protein product [Trichobilharzia regenti]